MNSDANNDSPGLSGSIARRFQDSKITPLLALAGLLLGLFAVFVTPREEEPQIDVTFANVFVLFPGASAIDVENVVAVPMEQVLAEIEGVEHTYSISRPGMAVLTVQFEVGEPRTEAIVRVYNAISSNFDDLPRGAGVLQPLVKPMGIDDVPILTITLWTEDPERSPHDLARVAHSIEAEIKRVPGTRDVYTVGAPEQVVHVRLDPQRMAAHKLSVDSLREALVASNVVRHAGAIVADNAYTPVTAGTFLASADDVAELVVGVSDGRPIYLDEVAEVVAGSDQPERYVWFSSGKAAAAKGLAPGTDAPAVTIAVAKKPGTNAAEIADAVIARLADLRGIYIPEGVETTITRNYGHTANDKAEQLIHKLLFATASVIVLVFVALGWREAVIVGSAVVITLAMTLFASWAWGFTINRVSLFALIFSIGILVDDAIVVVENIHRHLAQSSKNLLEVIPQAVNEVGGPTILATLTVIAALLPMAFVSGLMGPYMSPIPINASTGMLLSLAAALVFTPWASLKLLRRHARMPGPRDEQGALDAASGRAHVLERLARKSIGPFLGRDRRAARHRRWLYGGVAVGIAAAVSLVGLGWVVMKMLPFDNKSEFQVIVDMPEGTTVEETARVLSEMAAYLRTRPEVTDLQVYAGTAAPINFNGLVRQYYLREGANVGDIQVNLVERTERDLQSHDIALAVRAPLGEIAERYGASVKVVEVPPGPPVLAPLVAEIYGPDYGGQQRLAAAIHDLFISTDDIVDTDTSVERAAPRIVIRVDRHKAALLGVSQASVAATLDAALRGEDIAYLHDTGQRNPIPVRLELPVADKADLESLLMLRVQSRGGNLVPLAEVVDVLEREWEQTIHRKDLLPVVYVTGDMAGDLDSPLYGMFSMVREIANWSRGGGHIGQYFIGQPDDPYDYGIKWDGEWQITYETFRDMGLAYGVGLILIYLLVVAQSRSYLVPLIIMAPIALTIIGVLPGHAVLGREFTATSMIGMIALAGIIVRNSILLVDFIRHDVAGGTPLEEAVIRAAAVRAQPITLTALAAMLGAFFILDDPIFSGLAVSLIFGVFVSTLLTLVVIPVLYYSFGERASKEDGQMASSVVR
jgi:multidrug efflux pump subunit AcrB